MLNMAQNKPFNRTQSKFLDFYERKRFLGGEKLTAGKYVDYASPRFVPLSLERVCD